MKTELINKETITSAMLFQQILSNLLKLSGTNQGVDKKQSKMVGKSASCALWSG